MEFVAFSFNAQKKHNHISSTCTLKIQMHYEKISSAEKNRIAFFGKLEMKLVALAPSLWCERQEEKKERTMHQCWAREGDGGRERMGMRVAGGGGRV